MVRLRTPANGALVDGVKEGPAKSVKAYEDEVLAKTTNMTAKYITNEFEVRTLSSLENSQIDAPPMPRTSCDIVILLAFEANT